MRYYFWVTLGDFTIKTYNLEGNPYLTENQWSGKKCGESLALKNAHSKFSQKGFLCQHLGIGIEHSHCDAIIFSGKFHICFEVNWKHLKMIHITKLPMIDGDILLVC